MKKNILKNKSVRRNNLKHVTLEEVLMDFRHSMTSVLMDEAKENGCSLSQFEILRLIAEKDKTSMKDIAKQLHITPPSASSLVDSLVLKELVLRNHGNEDRRTIKVILSPKAHTLLVSIYKHKISVFNKMLSKLNMEDKNELARILTKCVN